MSDVIAGGAGKGYEMTKTGIVFRRMLTDDEYDALGLRIAHIANATGWAIGDWLVAGTGRGDDGSSYDRAAQITGRSYDSLSQYARVSAAYGHDERHHAPWTFYREALRLPSRERVDALRLCSQNSWNRSGLIDYINSRTDQRNAIETGARSSGSLEKKRGLVKWRAAKVPKRDVTCPECGHRFDVRRKGVTEEPIEAVERRVEH